MKKLPTLADRLVHARNQKGWTQYEVALKAGIRPEVLNRIERGKSPGALLSLHKLAPVLGMSIDELVGLAPRGSSAVAPPRGSIAVAPRASSALEPARTTGNGSTAKTTGKFPAMTKPEIEVETKSKAAGSGRKGKKRR